MCTRLFLLSFIYRVIPNIYIYIYVVPTEKLRLAWPTFECIRFSHFSRHFGSRYTTHWALFNLTRGRYYLLNTPKKNQLFWLFPSFKIQMNAFHEKQIWMFSPNWRESVPYHLPTGLRDLGKAMRWTSKNHVWGSAIPRTKHDSLLQYTLNVLLCLVRIWRIFNMNNDNWPTIPRSPHIKAPTRQHCSFFHKLPMARQLWHLWQLWNDGEMIKFTSIAFQMNNKSTWHVYPM